MLSMTYLALVAVLGLGLWRLTRGRRGGRIRGARTLGHRMGTMLGGPLDLNGDLVERMASCLVENTTVFGSSYAIPSYLGAELPTGVHAAASAAKAQLTGEVLDHYQGLMVERARRTGRAEFVLPAEYALRLALSCGPEERILASFDPIVDVRAAFSPPTRRPALTVVGIDDAGDRTSTRGPSDAGHEEPTAWRRPDAETTVVLLSVDGVPYAQRVLGAQTPVVTVGRGSEAGLRCPDDLHEVSRVHAELTAAHGRLYVEDKYSANGTLVQRSDGESVGLVPGEPTAMAHGDVVWFDEQRQVTVTVL